MVGNDIGRVRKTYSIRQVFVHRSVAWKSLIVSIPLGGLIMHVRVVVGNESALRIMIASAAIATHENACPGQDGKAPWACIMHPPQSLLTARLDHRT